MTPKEAMKQAQRREIIEELYQRLQQIAYRKAAWPAELLPHLEAQEEAILEILEQVNHERSA